MNAIGIIGLLLGIVFLIWGAYKGLGALPLSLIAAIIVTVTNGMPLWSSLSSLYMAGYAGTYTGYFLIFAFSALYAKVMDTAGCTTTIGYKMIDWFGKKSVILVIILITAVLTYGGVSLFVCIFAVGPIAFMLLKQANLPRSLVPGAIYVGAATLTMTSLPGSPQLTNIIPSNFLGTSMTAAPILGIICSIFLLGGGIAWMLYSTKKRVAAGEVFTAPAHIPEAAFAEKDRSTLPNAWQAFIPVVFLILFIIIGGRWIKDANMLTCLAMVLSAILCYILNFKFLKKASLKKILADGLGDAIPAIGGLAAVVAFGTVVSNSGAFTKVVEWVLSLKMSPYWKGIFSTAVISGITGSSSGGLKLMYQNMAEYFVNSGCNLEFLHRLTAIAAGSLDSLPHCSGTFLLMAYTGCTHKDSYKDICVVSVIIPAIVVVVATLIVTLIGM